MAPSSISQLGAEFKSNPRLRAGIGLCVAILWVYGLLQFQDQTAAKAKEYETVAKRIARIQATAEQKDWQTRADQARAIENTFADSLWQEQTQGLAQAAFQDWLVQSLQQAAIAKPQLTVSGQEGPKARGPADEMWKISAHLVIDFNPKTFTLFIDKLAGHQKRVVVEALNVRSVPSPRAEMTLVAYFVKKPN